MEPTRANRTIPNNKLGIVIHDNKTGTCTFMDAAISGNRNVIKKEADKILKYKDLKKNQRMRYVKAEVIPVISGAIGTISKSIRQYLSNIPESRKSRN
jgi:hypothetical protein